jgi:hypothetical protein
MKTKTPTLSTPVKKYRVLFTLEFEAADRAAAIEKAKTLVDHPDAKLRVQESLLGWMTVSANGQSASAAA